MEENNLNRNNEFEDIVSDTSGHSNSINDDFIYFDTFSDTKYFKKQRRGIKKLLVIADWWRERKKWQKALMITVTSLVLVLAIMATVVFTVFDYNYNKITEKPEDLGFTEVIDNKIINIALFGIDTRNKKSFKGLSDSIMILSLNTKTKKVKIISVMRDSLVPITYNGKTSYLKINSAYSKGGPELAIKTLNTIFGLDISEYATVNFFGMADIIDAVGGIDAELTQGEITGYHGINSCVDEICKKLGVSGSKYHLKTAGKHHLNGIQAVAYSRIRYQTNIWGTSNDYGRTDRQRYVMEQLFNKAVKMEKSQYMKLAKALIPCAETSLSYSEIINLATSVLLHSPTFEQSRVPLTEYQMGSKSVLGAGSCIYYDLDYAGKLIHAFIYDNITPEDYMEQNGIEKNDWYKGSTYRPNPNSSQGGNSSTTSSQGDSSSNTDSSDITSSDEIDSSNVEGTDSSNIEGTDSSDIDGTDSSGDGTASDGSSNVEGTDSSGSQSQITSSDTNTSSDTGSDGNSSNNTTSGNTSGTPSDSSQG